jgi:hypothetical protein
LERTIAGRYTICRASAPICSGTHLLHLETMGHTLYRESITFLEGGDEAPPRSDRVNRSFA